MAGRRLTRIIRKTSLKAGASLVGFAPMSRFDNAPETLHPRNIFPQANTLIAVAVPQLRGTLKTVEEGTYWQGYNVDSYYFPNDVFAPHMLRKIGMKLEELGYTAVPVHNPFFHNVGRKVREEHATGPDAMISLRLAGVAAGLGELGRHKLLLTPEFGPRQRVFAMLTDAELVPTPLFKGKICDDCRLCETECQAGAIGQSRDVEVTIEDTTFTHAELDCRACSRVHRAAVDPRYNPFRAEDDLSEEMYPLRYVEPPSGHAAAPPPGRARRAE